ncbi:MAG: hypothetical protein M3128_12400, partial [Verrucomicrobiota bacterium]|nr:hypothetical protein [Verrucomicrobiota bacterium]
MVSTDRALEATSTIGEEISSIPKKFQYALRLNIRGVYDDNIFLIQGERVGDYYLAIEPGLTLGYGDIVGESRNYVQFDYAPSFFIYADHSSANAVQHLMHLVASYRTGHLKLGLGQDIQLLEGTNPLNVASIGTVNTGPGVNLDTGGGTKQNVYTTNGTFSYDLTGKTFLSGAAHYSRYDYPNLIGSQTISGNIFLNFNYSPKLVIGLGGTGGYNLVEGSSSDQTFEQLNATVTYQATGKVSLNGSVGVEFRQFDGGSYVSPVYDLSASYQPFDGTTITLNGNLRTQNSAVLVGQDYSLTDITLSIRQRLLRRFYVGLTSGYQHSNYFSTSTGVNASRVDNYYFFQPAIDATITRYWTAGFYYLHRQSNSSEGVFSFSNN